MKPIISQVDVLAFLLNFGQAGLLRAAATLTVAGLAVFLIMLRPGPTFGQQPVPAGVEDKHKPQEKPEPKAGEIERQKMAALRACLPGKTDEQIIAVLQEYVHPDPPAAGENRAHWFSRRLRQSFAQHGAVAAIEHVGGIVSYDYELDAVGQRIIGARPPGNRQLQEILGEDFFADTVAVGLEPSEGVGVEDEELRELKPHLAALPKLTTLSLSGSPITDAGLKAIEGLTQLENFDLSYTKVTDAWLKHLRGLTRLKRLNLHSTKLSDTGMQSLKGLVNLRELRVSYNQVSDQGLAHVAQLTGLEILDLSWNEGITDAGLAHVENLRQLRELHLGVVSITDEGLKHLAGLTRLEFLDLNNDRKILGDGLKYLSGLTRLERLVVYGAPIEDVAFQHAARLKALRIFQVCSPKISGSGLPHLKGLPRLELLNLDHARLGPQSVKALAGLIQLKTLCIRDTPLSNGDVERLRKALPKCKIEWEPSLERARAKKGD